MQISVPENVALAERAHRALLGLDLFDEVWDGEYRMAPAAHWGHGYLHDQVVVLFSAVARSQGLMGTSPFNLGSPNNYRVPDHGYHRTRPLGVWNPTAALVIEIVSPGDASTQKFDFYAAQGVEEVIVIDPSDRSVRCTNLSTRAVVATSAVLGLVMAEVEEQLDWPSDD